MRVQRGPSEHDTYAGIEAPRSLSAATVLESTNVQQQDPLGQAGWGTARWTKGQMKARKDFMLPVPPIGLHVINSSVADWQNLLNISHGFGHKTNKLLPPSTKVFHRRSELSFAIAQMPAVLRPDAPSTAPASSNHLTISNHVALSRRHFGRVINIKPQP